MKKVKLIAGIIWAFLGLVLIIALFPGLPGFSKSLASLPFMKINPNYTGGEIVYRDDRPACTLIVHKPVFDGLFRERKKGFVQVDWKGKIPETISDTVDYNNDGKPDFLAKIDVKSNTTTIVPLRGDIKSLNVSTPVSFGWSIRVNLQKDK